MSFSTTAARLCRAGLFRFNHRFALSLLVGAKPLPFSVVIDAFTGTCQSADCTIVLDARLPRTLAGLLAGAALGLAGALMQTLTRNPLADPGFSASTPAPASLSCWARRCLVSSPQEQLLMAFCGALGASLLVAFTGSQGGGQLSPVRLTLAGSPWRRCWKGFPTASPCSTLTSTTSCASGRPVAGYPHPANAENRPDPGGDCRPRDAAAEPGA
jgi:iron complex transport system permease protein